MIYPTVRATVLMAAGLPLTLLLAVMFPGLWTVGAGWIAGVAGLIFLDAVLAVPRRAVTTKADPPPQIYIGEDADLDVHCTYSVARRPRLCEMRLTSNLNLSVDPEIGNVYPAGAGSIARFKLTARRRGEGFIERLWMRWQGPFGLIWMQNVKPLELRIPVVPNTRLVKDTAIEIFSRDAIFGQKIQMLRGEGTEFDALTEFQTGMDRRALDWKHSARHNKLLAKEFRTERNHNIVFALDSGHLMCEPIEGMTKIDWALNASLLMAYVSLKIGDRVGYYAFDNKPYFYTQPVAGVGSFGHLQNLTANIDYSHSETNFTLGLSQLSTHLSRRSLVVVFTDFVDTTNAELMVENVTRLIRKHVVIFVAFRDATIEELIRKEPETTEDISRAVIAEKILRERDLVIARLQRLGVHIVDTDIRDLNVGLLNTFLELKRQEKI